MRNNVKVFEVDMDDVVVGMYAPLLRSRGVSGRAEVRISRIVRLAIQKALYDTIQRAYLDGSAPYRTGRGKAALFAGVRAFGTTLNTLRGHIVGPSYMKAHEDGATITPVKSKTLTIPLPPALRPDGTPKLPGPRSWGNILNTFIYKSKRTGQGYIAYKNVNDELILLYVFIDQAVMSRYQGFLHNAFNLQKPGLIEAFGRALFFEMSRVNFLPLMGVTYKGRRRGR